MSKGLGSIPEESKMTVAMRRAANDVKGCGYWGAVSFLNKKGIRTPEQKREDAVNEILQNVATQANNALSREKKREKFRTFRQPSVLSLSEKNRKRLQTLKAH